MCRVIVGQSSVSLWVSRRETRAWARKEGEAWPCSVTADNSLHVEYDSNGSTEKRLNSGKKKRDIPTHELNAIAFDFLKGRVPIDHPCWYVIIGQFIQPVNTSDFGKVFH